MSEAVKTTSPDTPKRPLARYTRFVHSTKMLMAVVAALLVALILFYPLFKSQDGGVRIALTGTSEKPVSSTNMTNARFHGLDKDNQLYTVNVKKVEEISEEQINLQEPSGEILLKSKQHVYARADTGVFNKKTRILKLKGAIKLSIDDGYTLKTELMSVDIDHNTAATSMEVFGDGPMGTLKAYGGAMADTENQQIVFQGPVFMTLNMDAKEKTKQEKK